MFPSLRIQIMQPCQARCRWCVTHKKNPVFAQLQKDGGADAIHELYAQVVERIKPRDLFVSGGEPLLLPNIAKLMERLAPHVERIHLFTSYQFSRQTRERMDLSSMPWDKVLLTHTISYFKPEGWEELSQGFPFDVYVGNIKGLGKIAQRKTYKFIINHPDAMEELTAFLTDIDPDEATTLRWKLMNQQGSLGFNRSRISQTRRQVLERLENWEELSLLLQSKTKAKVDRQITGATVVTSDSGQGAVESCPYRKEPLELRFAYYRVKGKIPELQYRFCPHFPPKFRHVFRVGENTFEDIVSAFEGREFHKHCHKCRLKLYVEG